MDNKKALEIANQFINEMNPTLWDGNEPMPQIDQRIWEDNDTFDDISIQLSFTDNDIDVWCTYVELVDKVTDTMIECQTCYGIDSPQNIADSIMDLCGLQGR